MHFLKVKGSTRKVLWGGTSEKLFRHMQVMVKSSLGGWQTPLCRICALLARWPAGCYVLLHSTVAKDRDLQHSERSGQEAIVLNLASAFTWWSYFYYWERYWVNKRSNFFHTACSWAWNSLLKTVVGARNSKIQRDCRSSQQRILLRVTTDLETIF